jgi:ATP-dependent DNA helicase RecG
VAITLSQIDIWINSETETQRLEFKEAKNQFSNEKLYKYCVAIANEGGGHLILGVSDKKPRKIVGTSAFNNIIEMATKIFREIGFRVDIEEFNHQNGRILIFVIPGRPLGTAYHYEGAYLMRSGESLVPMSEDKLRHIFAEGQPGWLENTSIDSLSPQEVIELLDTQTYFELLNLPYPSSQKAVIDRLLQEKLITHEEGNYSILNIGAILLAKNLKSFSNLSRKAPRVIEYKGESKLETITDVIGEKGYAVGFQGLVKYVNGKLPQNEVIEDAIRKEVKLLPEVIIRELLANALIHQDFELTGTSPIIEIYSDRVEISNPGEPIVPVERFIDGYQSRNERLADLMRRFGICEEKSSGIDRVIESSEIFQLPAPDFLVGHHQTIVVIYGPKPFQKMDGSDRVRACYQHCVLQYVLRKQMTNQSLRERFGISERSSNKISQIINSAIEQGLIKSDPSAPDSRRYARYIPYWA